MQLGDRVRSRPAPCASGTAIALLKARARGPDRHSSCSLYSLLRRPSDDQGAGPRRAAGRRLHGGRAAAAVPALPRPLRAPPAARGASRRSSLAAGAALRCVDQTVRSRPARPLSTGGATVMGPAGRPRGGGALASAPAGDPGHRHPRCLVRWAAARATASSFLPHPVGDFVTTGAALFEASGVEARPRLGTSVPLLRGCSPSGVERTIEHDPAFSRSGSWSTSRTAPSRRRSTTPRPPCRCSIISRRR